MDPSPPPSSETVARRFRRQPRRDTAPELAVRRRLHARGVRYRVDVRPCTASRARGDLRKDHGAPHHSHARGGTLQGGHRPHANSARWAAKLAGNTARDRRADEVLRAEGWRVLRFWEHEDPDAVADAICPALGRPVPAESVGAVV